MNLSRYKLSKIRERLHKEAEILEAVSRRLEDLCGMVPAPDLEELRALEAGDVPLSIEAMLISILSEQYLVVDESAVALRSGASVNRPGLSDGWWTGRQPDAKVIAHLRSGLRGRTLLEDFRPEHAELDPSLLLFGQRIPVMGAGMVADLLLRGYRWGG